MNCTFCKQVAPQLTPHHLCSSCVDHVKCCSNLNDKSNQPMEPFTGMILIPKMEQIVDGECEACLGRFQEDDLPQHKVQCSARVVFQCLLCRAIYPSKEALWRHLDSHEEADEGKDLICSEKRITYQTETCALCDDQRSYQYNAYWEHIHEHHDGFYLKCFDCGESFRSKKLQTDHALNHCEDRRTTDLQDSLVEQEVFNLQIGTFDDFDGIKEEIEVGDTELMSEAEQVPASEDWMTDRCPICDENFVDSDLERISKHVEEIHKVAIYTLCSATFHNGYELHDHQVMCSSTCQDLADVEPRSTASNYQAEDLMEGATFSETSEVPHTSKAVAFKPISTVCSHCNRDFNDTTLLDRHIEFCHQPIVCDICEITLHGTTEARDHTTKIHTQNPFICVHCPMKFRSQSGYIVHLIKHLKDHTFSCGTCDHEFSSLACLISHSSTVHNMEDAWLKIHRTFKECYVLEPKLALEQGLQQKNVESLFRAPRMEQPPRNESSQQATVKLNQPNLPVAMTSEKSPKTRLKCSYCVKTYSTRSGLKHHIVAKHVDVPVTSDAPKQTLKCSHCPRVFDANWKLHRHFTERHRKAHGVVCEVSLAGKSQARHHSKKGHFVPQHQCPHCEEKFFARAHLTLHLNLHVQERNFPCSLCGVRFKSQRYVNYHIRQMQCRKVGIRNEEGSGT